MKFLSAGLNTQSLWKNGKGETAQIGIFPENARFSDGDFLWRLSAATLTKDSDFSLFPGYERKLVIWSGDGLRLNGKVLLPFDCLSFSGTQEIHAQVIGARIKDLGIIYRASKVEVWMEIQFLKENESIQVTAEDGIQFVFCAQGNIGWGDCTLASGDALQLQSGDSGECLCLSPEARIIRVRLQGFSS